MIQHAIPILYDVKPVKKKIREIFPNIEAQIKTDLNSLLKAKIIFLAGHSKWVSILVYVGKNNGDIRNWIGFSNLNRECENYNFPLPLMEHILQSVTHSKLMSFLNGFLRYNQILMDPK